MEKQNNKGKDDKLACPFCSAKIKKLPAGLSLKEIQKTCQTLNLTPNGRKKELERK